MMHIESHHFFDVSWGELGKYSLTELTFGMTSVNREIILILPIRIVFQYTYCLLYLSFAQQRSSAKRREQL